METKYISPVATDTNEYIRECVAEASKIISAYWPISTFIASNGLANLEDLPFEEAIKQDESMMGGVGFLPLTTYHKFLAAGRISEKEVDTVISTAIEEQQLPKAFLLGDKQIITNWLIKFWMLENWNSDEIKEQKKPLWETVFMRLQAQNLLDYPDIQTASERIFNRSGHPIIEAVDRRIITFCAAFLDQGQAAWRMPGREKGFYKCWKELAGLEGGAGKKLIRKKVQTLPDAPETALAELLTELEIPQEAWGAYLTRHLAQLPGWASLIRWRQEHPETQVQQQFPANLMEYLVVRIFYEVVLVETQLGTRYSQKSAAKSSTIAIDRQNTQKITRLVMLFAHLNLSPNTVATLSNETMLQLSDIATIGKLQSLWQEAFEYNYRHNLLSQLVKSHKEVSDSVKPAAQAIFCIDVRSEGLRRHLEQAGAYETFGFAGFFGVPMLYRPFGSSCDIVIAPALLTPTQPITEMAKGVSQKTIEWNLAAKSRRYQFRELVHSLRENLLTPFAFVEMFGWVSIFPLVGKTLSPRKWKKMQASIQAKMSPEVPTVPSTANNEAVMTYQAQAKSVAGMLASIGLTKDFARLVLVCGHGSETENNPYASALDCGACGGNHGGYSASVAVSMLNTPQVRKLLAEQDIVIPAHTYFLAGEHNTTTDTISISNESDIPDSHRAEFEQFKLNLAEAGKHAALDRWSKFLGKRANLKTIGQQVEQRAADWAQVRPEWGLVRNAAFICGSRRLTSHLNLENRVFLHSYDQNQDATGAILEGIMTAPVVVAEWINMQYYFSTVDNEHFGSGSKLLHTVVGQVGVMQGRHSDLRRGLPQQAVMLGEELFHEPLRLSVIVEAAPETISNIIAKHKKLQQLTRNKWITLVAYDSFARQFYRYTPNGKWAKLELDSPALSSAAA